MKHQASKALLAAWDLWRDGDTIANPATVNRADLAPLLPNLLLLDLREPEFRIRYGGTAIAVRYGHDIQGESFMSFWDAGDAAGLARLLAGMKTRRAGLVAGFLGETAGGGCTAFELLLLPLGSANACISAIGIMARTGGHDDRNRLRARLLSQSLVSVRHLDRPSDPKRELRSPIAILPRGNDARGRFGHLTLVHGGR